MQTVSEQTSFFNENSDKFSIIEGAFSAFHDKRQWVVSGSAKVPWNPLKNINARSNYPEDWITLAQALHACKQAKDMAYFPAIALHGTDLCIIDLDDCLEDGLLPQWAQDMVNRFDSYTEVSRSGNGLHIVMHGEKPGRRCKKGGLEIYDGKDSKFITLTGALWQGRAEIKAVSKDVLDAFYFEHFPEKQPTAANTGTKSPSFSDEQVLDLCYGPKGDQPSEAVTPFFLLYEDGGKLTYPNHTYPSQSEADLALCRIISYYTQDVDQIDRIFRKSQLLRPKWEEREDYRNNTIEKAIQAHRSFYQPPIKNIEIDRWESPLPIDQGDEDLDIPFPVECLPKCMSDAVQEVARSVQVDPAMAAIPALAMVALQIGKKLLVEEEPGLLHHPSLFLVCAMSQVERKSETCKRIIGPIKDAIEQEGEGHKREMARVKAHNDAVAEQMTAVKKMIRDGKDELNRTTEELKKQLEDLILSKKDFPAPPENWGDDITPQRLQQCLHIHGGAFGLFSSEGRTIFSRILDKNDQEGASSKGIYTAATWGDDLDRSRVGNGDTGEAEIRRIRQPALTIMAFIQKDLWEAFSRDRTMRLSGTLSRVCVAQPPSKAGTRLKKVDDVPHNPSKVVPYVNAVMQLRQWNPEKSVVARLSPEAARERRKYYNEIEQEVGPGGRYEDVADIAGRSCSITARIAASFVAIELAEKGDMPAEFPTISEELWVSAESLGEYFLAQGIDSQRSHGKKGVDHLLQKAARWLLKRVADKPRVLPWEFKAFVRGLEDEQTSGRIVCELEKAGWIRKREEIRPNVHAYEINGAINSFVKASADNQTKRQPD